MSNSPPPIGDPAPAARPPAALPAGGPAALPAGGPAGLPAGGPPGLPASLPPGLPASLPPGLPASLPADLPADLPASLPTGLPAGLPAVSVIMPAYRAAATLASSVASVQAQTFGDWELILVDDASPDDTGALAAALASGDARIRLLTLAQNGGAARARNAAIAQARGRHIAFLDADDLWLPDKLARQLAFMAQTGAALSYTGFWVEKAGVRRAVRIPAAVTRAQLLRGNVIGCLTAMYDAGALGRVMMPDLRMNEDYGLWLRILARVPAAQGLQENLAVHRRQSGSLTDGTLRRLRATWRLYREVEQLPRLTALRCLAAHVMNRLRSRA